MHRPRPSQVKTEGMAGTSLVLKPQRCLRTESTTVWTVAVEDTVLTG
jgi:hypothetical protein